MIFVVTFAIAVIVFMVVVTIILLIVGPTILLKPRRRTAQYYQALGAPVTPEALKLPAETTTITTRDGLTLDCWLIRAGTPARGTVIYLHGVGDCKIDGLRFAKLMNDHRFHVFLFDSRSHGESSGKFCTYGYYEKDDTIRIIDHLQTSGIATGKIGLFGTSMGAAVAIQTAAIDNRIAAVVAENSFATLRSIFDDYQRRMIKLPFHFLRNFVIKRSERLAKFRANDVSPLEAVRKLQIPILFIYSENDQLIKSEYSRMLFENTSAPRELFPVKNATHTDTWSVAGPVYEQRLLDFFERNLG